MSVEIDEMEDFLTASASDVEVALRAEEAPADLVVEPETLEVVQPKNLEVAVPERKMVSDADLQARLTEIAPGVRIANRCTLGVVTDVFVNGGDFAPGRSRWIQTQTFDSLESQAQAVKAMFV